MHALSNPITVIPTNCHPNLLFSSFSSSFLDMPLRTNPMDKPMMMMMIISTGFNAFGHDMTIMTTSETFCLFVMNFCVGLRVDGLLPKQLCILESYVNDNQWERIGWLDDDDDIWHNNQSALSCALWNLIAMGWCNSLDHTACYWPKSESGSGNTTLPRSWSHCLTLSVPPSEKLSIPIIIFSPMRMI